MSIAPRAAYREAMHRATTGAAVAAFLLVLAEQPELPSGAPMLAGDGIIRRFVVRVDALARGARDDCPAAIAAIADVDTRAAATLYARMYPLLQQAYEQQSPGRGYFNDRLVEAIDRLIGEEPCAPPARDKLREMRKVVALRAPG
jgi:hypothetical protein